MKCSITRRVTVGDSSEPPSATTRIARSSSAGSPSSSTKPRAPAGEGGEAVLAQTILTGGTAAVFLLGYLLLFAAGALALMGRRDVV